MNLDKKFSKWKTKNNQYGRQAFSRFIMLTFLDGLQNTSEDFIFKGGNLLWHYIKTPRETTDLDLSTISLKSHLEVRKAVEKSFEKHDEIIFKVKEFKEIGGAKEIGADIIISFSTTSGQTNQFSIDIVYALPTDIAEVQSTLNEEFRLAASIENIICDKLSAAHQFKSGNTRMKDFDDLWRISKSDIQINPKNLLAILSEREITRKLDMEWVSFLEPAWKRYSKSYKDIPGNLVNVFSEINRWLENVA